MKKDFKLFPPMMEGVPVLGAMFSLDYGSNPAPEGSIDFLERYGYVLIRDLYKFEDWDYDKFFDYLDNILKKYLKMDVEKGEYQDLLYTNKDLSVPKSTSKLTAVYQHHTNLKETSCYIETKNKENHLVYLNRGDIIIFDDETKIRYQERKIFNILDKFKPIQHYFHQIVFNFNLK